jgi:L-fuculose-phosphate aldolase
MAMAHRPIPAAHGAIALFGSPIVRCANYAPFGTKELAALALEALGSGHAALLGNWGALATGGSLEAAIARARELETLARLYAIALSLGRPAVLSDEEVARIAERLKSNGDDIEARITPKAKTPAKGKRAASRRATKKKSPRRKARAVNAPTP